jgi:hypothetical protein
MMVDIGTKRALAQTVLDFAHALGIGHRQPLPDRPLIPPAR